MTLPRLLRQRAAAMGAMVAVSIVPILGFAGLAVDFTHYGSSSATVMMAANSAALNAVRIATVAQESGDSAAKAEGQAAGTKWFASQAGSNSQDFTLSSSSTTVTLGTTVSATVTYSGTISSFLGSMFGIGGYPFSGQASAANYEAPYLTVDFLIDNSLSMQIGASTADMQILSEASLCDSSNAYYPPTAVAPDSSEGGFNYTQGIAGDGGTNSPFWDYQCEYDYFSYDGAMSCPFQVSAPFFGSSQAVQPGPTPSYYYTGNGPWSLGPSCKGVLKADVNGNYPSAGGPCALACHWDKTGKGNDLFGMARRLIGTANAPTLRIDVVKAATNAILTDIEDDTLRFGNVQVGIYTFADDVAQVYPSSGEASPDIPDAIAAVGGPPTTSGGADTGFVPTFGPAAGMGMHDDTDFPDSITDLTRKYLSQAGNGTSASAPRKVLFLLTDGFQDYPSSSMAVSQQDSTFQAFDSSFCTQAKSLGYTVFVIYMTYYPLEATSYLYSGQGPYIAENASIPNALQACASSPSDYAQATDTASIVAAMNVFLTQAVVSPAHLTK